MERRPRFLVGLILLVINQPFGWGAMVVCAVVAARTNKTIFYLIGLGAYAFSWALLGLGLVLAGPEGRSYLRSFWEKIWERVKRSDRSMGRYDR
jgi:hypothetical protein